MNITPRYLIKTSKSAKALLMFFAFILPLTKLLNQFVRATQVVGILIGILALLDMLKNKHFVTSSAHVYAFIFLTYQLITLAWVGYRSIGITSIINYAEVFGIFWLSYYFLTIYNIEKKRVLAAYVLGVFVLYVSIFIIQFLIGPEIHSLATYNQRLQLRIINANAVSYILSFAVFSLVVIFQRPHNKKRGVLIYSGILLFILGILMTGTRSAVVGLIFAFVLGSYQFDNNTVYKILFSVILVVPIVIFITPESFLRIIKLFREIFAEGVYIFVGSSSIGTLNYRLSIWKAGSSLIQNSPILGVGVGQFEPLVDPVLTRATAPHNAIIGTWAEFGIIGLTIFIALLKSSFLGIYHNVPERERTIALPFVGFVIIMLMLTNILGSVHLWFIMGILLSYSTEIQN